MQPRARNGHVVHLHVLERYQQCLGHRRVRKQLTQFLLRKIPARVHSILHAPQRNNKLLTINAEPLHFLSSVEVAHQANTIVRARHQQVLFRLMVRRLLIPAEHVDTAHGSAKVRSLHDLQLQTVGRPIRWVEGRKALVTAPTPKHHHARQYRVHRQRRPERRFAEHNVILCSAKLQLLHGHDDELVEERRVLSQKLQVLVLPLGPQEIPTRRRSLLQSADSYAQVSIGLRTLRRHAAALCLANNMFGFLARGTQPLQRFPRKHECAPRA